MKILNSFDRFVGKNLPWLSLVLTGIGVAFPAQFGWLSGCTFWLFAFMTFCSSLNADFGDIKTVFFNPKPILVVFFCLHVLMPLITLGIATLLFQDNPDVITGMVLENCIPTGVVSLMWVSMAHGNTPLTLCMVLLDTLFAPLVVPLTLRVLIGSTVEMDVTGMMLNLLEMIALPALLALICNQVTHGRAAKNLQPKLNPISKLALVLIIVANSTGIADTMHHLNRQLIVVILVGIGISILGFLAGMLFARLLRVNYPTTLSMTLNCGMRNINAGAVLAAQYFSAEVLFPVVTSSLMLHPLNGLFVTLLRCSKAGKAAQQSITPSSQ